jgi:leader peptidase (prepilin peptidase)/N-methyltransferase
MTMAFTQKTLPIVAFLTVSLVLAWLCGLAVERLVGETPRWFRHLVRCAMLILAVWVRIALPSQLLAPTCALAFALIVLAATDVRTLRLPDIITLPLAACGLLLSPEIAEAGLLDRAIGGALAYAGFAGIGYLYRFLRKKDGLGLGDAKLAAAAGAWMGWAALPSVLLLASGFGLCWVLVRRLQDRASLRQPLPFGAPLAGAFWLIWLYGPLRF